MVLVMVVVCVGDFDMVDIVIMYVSFWCLIFVVCVKLFIIGVRSFFFDRFLVFLFELFVSDLSNVMGFRNCKRFLFFVL